MVTAVYPGRFDPVTLGHVDIAQRAATLFDRVVVAVYDLPPEGCLFTTEERVKLFAGAIGHIEHAEVKSFSGLIVDFVRKERAKALVRGIRAVSDYEYELQMALMNRELSPGLETVFMLPAQAYSYFSSHLVREVASLGGSIKELVPPTVEARIRAKVGS